MAKRIPPKVTGADACPTCNGYGSPAPLRMICPDCGGSGARQAPVPDADVPAMLDQIATLRADLAASQREVERLRTDLDAATYSATTIRGAYVDVADALLPSSAAASDLVAEARRLRDVERDALPLRGELDRCREIIESLVSVRCDERSDGFITHGVIVADALRYLASIGRVEIVSEQGRRVVARWTK